MRTIRSKSAAFSLVEVAIAIAITSFCLIALFGLLPIGLKSNETSIEQSAANGILSEVTADLRATPPTVPSGLATTSQQFLIPIPANPVTTAPTATTLYFTSDGRSSAESGVTGPWSYLVTITFLTNGSTAKSATFANLQVSWPASVQAANAVGSVRTFVALDRN
jgi:uncharacterized protein (TIGR02598 family)